MSKSNIEKFKENSLTELKTRIMKLLEEKRFVDSVKTLNNFIPSKKYGSIHHAISKLHQERKIYLKKYLDINAKVEKVGIALDPEILVEEIDLRRGSVSSMMHRITISFKKFILVFTSCSPLHLSPFNRVDAKAVIQQRHREN